VDGLVALGTIFIPGLAEVKDLSQAANMALKLIAKGGFEKAGFALPSSTTGCAGIIRSRGWSGVVVAGSEM
jgi:hypothetical protein